MNIQYYGDYCFKITTKPAGRATDDVVIVTDAPEKGTGLRAPQGEAHLLLLSHQDPDHEALSVIKGDPIVLSTPGEYSARGVTVVGLPSSRDSAGGKERGVNTVFLVEVEDIRLAYLGALGHMLTPETIERLDGVDVLFVPAAGSDTISIAEVDDLVRKIEPKTVIPMHYKIAGMTGSLPDESALCKALGNCPTEKISKWNVRAKDLEGKNMEVVLLDKN